MLKFEIVLMLLMLLMVVQDSSEDGTRLIYHNPKRYSVFSDTTRLDNPREVYTATSSGILTRVQLQYTSTLRVPRVCGWDGD
jgi:hypothetical protein